MFPSAMDLKVTYRKIGHERGGLFEALTRSSKDSCQENDSASNVFHSNFTGGLSIVPSVVTARL